MKVYSSILLSRILCVNGQKKAILYFCHHKSRTHENRFRRFERNALMSDFVLKTPYIVKVIDLGIKLVIELTEQ